MIKLNMSLHRVFICMFYHRSKKMVAKSPYRLRQDSTQSYCCWALVLNHSSSFI
uniref:Uncharacterized protein n=1 Tax=Arundo donax TaxID=35708 RepID=A0A0A8YF29_ARUDO